MMQFLEQEISEITETTWDAMLGLEIRVNLLPGRINFVDEFWTGTVEIYGAWHGVVLLHGSGKLAHSAASVIFGHLASTPQDRKDAMYELTNVIAGNIKALLPGPSHLSLPLVLPTTPEGLTVPHAERVSELVFDCQDQPLWVALWKR